MRALPVWALEMLAKPRMDLFAEMIAEPDPELAEAIMFRFQLLNAFVNVRHLNPDGIQDPLLRVMVRLADENAYDMNLDSGSWVALFSVLRDNSPAHFAMWFNHQRDKFWLDPNLDAIAPWAYEDASGNVVDRFPHMSKAIEELQAAVDKSLKPPASSRPPVKQVTTKQGGCYIATAVYGSYDAPPVMTLRRFRDHQLSRTALGRSLIRCYYAVSPTLSKHFESGTALNGIARRVLDAFVRRLEP